MEEWNEHITKYITVHFVDISMISNLSIVNCGQ